MDEYQRFEQWLLKNGAFFEKLELREYPSSNVDEGLGDDNNDTNESMTNPMIDIDEQEEKKEGLMELDKVDDEYDNDTNNNDPNTTTTTTSSSSSSSSIRGVFCKTSITPNTVCMSVPRKCLITVEMGQETPIGQQILRANLDLDAPKHIFLMIFILQDRLNTQSFFKPYYDVLPKELSMPIFWSEDDLNFLKGSYLLQQVMDRIDAIEEDYQSICDICTNFSTNIATLDEFKWARMCVCSRNFGLQIDGIRTSAMVPYADMLNHYRPRETKWTFDDDQQAFTITTLQPMQGGCEIYDSYGQKCNHRFLLNYGFAIERNIEMDGFCPNEVPIEITLDDISDDQKMLYEDKLEFWCREDAPICKRVRVCVSNNENTKTLFSLLRVVVADANEFPILLHGIGTTFATTASTSTTATSPSVSNNNNNDISMQDTTTTETTATAESNNPSTSSVTISSSSTSLGTIRHPHHLGGNNRHFRPMTTATTTTTKHGSGAGGGGNNTTTTRTTTNNVFVPMGIGYRTSRDVRFPISIRNEIAMLQKLLSIVHYNLSQYPTTMEQDREALGRNNKNNTTTTTNSNNSGATKTTTIKNKHELSPRSNQVSNSNNKNESVNARNDHTLNESSSTSSSPYDNITLPPFSNRRHAVIQVMGEKEVLHYYKDLALTGLDVLNTWMNHHNNKNSNIEEQQKPQDDHKTKNDEEASTGTSVLGDTGSRSSNNNNNNNNHTTTTERIDTTIIKSLEQDGKHSQIIKYCTDLMRSLRGLSSSSSSATIRHGHGHSHHHSHRSQS